MCGPVGAAVEAAADELRDMYAVHTLFRREFGLAPGLVLGAAEGDAGQAGAVCEHVGMMLRLLVIHHEREGWCRGWGGPGGGGGGAVALGRHARLHEACDEVSGLMRAWRASAGGRDARSLALALERFAALCSEHLALREEQVLWPRAASLSFGA
jgi:hypothetical protein